MWKKEGAGQGGKLDGALRVNRKRVIDKSQITSAQGMNAAPGKNNLTN